MTTPGATRQGAVVTHLIIAGNFISHSGLTLSWKFDADALSDVDIESIARVAVSTGIVQRFSNVWGVPSGGIRLANAFAPWATEGDFGTLIVDDVLTTGASMEGAKQRWGAEQGFVILARTNPQAWIKTMFRSYEP